MTMKYLKNYNTFILEKFLDYSDKSLTSLTELDIPDFVDDHFKCSYNSLGTLEGSPREVAGDFICSTCDLYSLEGAPTHIGHDFVCSNNVLRDLEHSSEYIGGSFDCNSNRLTSLHGAPTKINENFNCSYNRLESLSGAPKEVVGNFNCEENKLTSLDYLPEISGNLYCFNNNWTKPIPYKIQIKYDLYSTPAYLNDIYWIYTKEQFDKFSSFEFQKEFLEREPENFIDLKPFGYAEGIEELFPHLFDMDELGLID